MEFNTAHRRNDEHQKLVDEATETIKTFIKNHPDHWKLMEIQYPLMAFLICARSFDLIKYILFEIYNDPEVEKFGKLHKIGKLHRPRSQYGSYPHYCEDLKLSNSDNDLKLALRFCKG